MQSSEFKRIREKLNLSQTELSAMFGFWSSKMAYDVELGSRKPSSTITIMMNLLDSLPPNEARDLVTKMTEQSLLSRDHL